MQWIWHPHGYACNWLRLIFVQPHDHLRFVVSWAICVGSNWFLLVFPSNIFSGKNKQIKEQNTPLVSCCQCQFTWPKVLSNRNNLCLIILSWGIYIWYMLNMCFCGCLQRELVVCSHNFLAVKRDHVARSLLAHSPFVLPEVSSESATTSLRGHTDGYKSCSEAIQRSDDITVDSTISVKHQTNVPITPDDQRTDDDCSTSQSHFTRKPSEKLQFAGKHIPQRPPPIATRNLSDDGGWRSRSRKVFCSLLLSFIANLILRWRSSFYLLKFLTYSMLRLLRKNWWWHQIKLPLKICGYLRDMHMFLLIVFQMRSRRTRILALMSQWNMVGSMGNLLFCEWITWAQQNIIRDKNCWPNYRCRHSIVSLETTTTVQLKEGHGRERVLAPLGVAL